MCVYLYVCMGEKEGERAYSSLPFLFKAKSLELNYPLPSFGMIMRPLFCSVRLTLTKHNWWSGGGGLTQLTMVPSQRTGGPLKDT